MAFDGSGVFNRIHSWAADAAAAVNITASRMDTEDDGFATGLSNCVTKDGQTTITANLPMATFLHTGVGVATARTHYARASQVQDGTLVYLTSVSGTDTITASATFSPSAYAAGQVFRFIAAGANAGAVTLNINSLGAKAVTKNGTVALTATDIISGAVVVVVYDGTRFQIQSMQPHVARENLLDNADFTIWQRGTSLAAIATGEHAADRWRWAQVGTGVVTISQETTVLPNEKTAYAIKIDVTTADTLIAAGDFYTITQRVEGPRAAAAGFGDADARSLTLSFWVRSPDTGAHDLAIRNSALDRAYVTTYTIAVADTWEFKVITIPGDTTGTWLKTSGAVGLHISFPLGVGLTYHGTTGTWEAANDLGVSGSATVIDDAASNFYLAEPKVEIGESATDYVPEHPAETELRCLRYYQSTFNNGTGPSATATGSRQYSAVATGGTNYYPIRLHIPMVSAPSVTMYNSNDASTGSWRDSTAGADRTTAVNQISTGGFRAGVVSEVATNVMIGHWTAAADL